MPHVLRLSDLISEGKLAGKRVFIRADLNVPQDGAGNITEDTRIRASVPAVKAALDAGGCVVKYASGTVTHRVANHAHANPPCVQNTT